MKLARLELKPLHIPFRVAFKHASAERRETQAVLAIAASEQGNTGYGEGCPRDYVTGETDTSVMEFFDRHRNDLLASVSDLPSLQKWTEKHRPDIDRNPAAWCALELALLDLLAREQGQTVEALLSLPALSGPFVYSAVLGATDAAQFTATLERYRKLGMHDFKIKLSGDRARDRGNIDAMHAAGITAEHVRADANNLWEDVDVARDYLRSLNFAFWAVEEPLRPGRFDDLSRLAQELKTRIVLDESITQLEQLAELPGAPGQWIVNLRVSKMGGLLRSLAVARRCREQGIALIVGAQVGETSLLARAALTVVQAERKNVIAQEGAYGTMLLEYDAFEPTLMFGGAGKLDAQSLRNRPGFGLARVSGA